MERQNILIVLVDLVVFHEDDGERGLIGAELDVDDIVDSCEDPLLLELLGYFVPIGQIGAAVLASGTVLIFSKVLRLGVTADEVCVWEWSLSPFADFR